MQAQALSRSWLQTILPILDRWCQADTSQGNPSHYSRCKRVVLALCAIGMQSRPKACKEVP